MMCPRVPGGPSKGGQESRGLRLYDVMLVLISIINHYLLNDQFKLS